MPDGRRSADVMSGMPLWVRATSVVGIPTMFLAAVLWFTFTKFEDHVADTRAIVQHFNDDAERAWATLSVMQRICLNTAQTDADRVACVAITAAPSSR